MKKIIISLLLIVMAVGAMVGCSDSTKIDPPKYGYGNASDGTVMSGEWTLGEKEVSTIAKETSTVFKTDASKLDYSLSFGISAKDVASSNSAEYGAYAYYKDITHFVKVMVRPKTKEIAVQCIKGYDEQSINAFLPADTNVSKLKIEMIKIGDEMRFYADDIQITTVTEKFVDAGQYGFIATESTLTINDIAFEDAKVFPTRALNLLFTPAVGTAGTWSITGNSVSRTDSDPATANIESVVFNAPVANNYSFEATAQQSEPAIVGGYGYYGVVGFYNNANNYVVVFFKDIYVDILVVSGGDYNWTGGVAIPNQPENKINKVRFDKLGSIMRVYVNDVYVRELKYSMFTRPGSVGFDTNGASALFEAKKLNSIDSLDCDMYQKDGMMLVNYAHLLGYDSGKYTTIDENLAAGANYGGLVITQSYMTGNDYEYLVDVHTANLGVTAGNFTGVIGGVFGDNYVSLMIDAQGNCDLFGKYVTKGTTDDAGNIVDGKTVNNAFAGEGKKLGESSFENGVLKPILKIKVVKAGSKINFFVEGEATSSIEIPLLKYSRAGVIANFVGASFEIK